MPSLRLGASGVWTDAASGVRAPAGPVTPSWLTRLDRLGRSSSRAPGAGPVSPPCRSAFPGEQIDTASAAGRLVLHVFGALAEFEQALMHERTMAGLTAARTRGRVGGRPRARAPPSSTTPKRCPPLARLSGKSLTSLAVGRSTVYRSLRGTGITVVDD